jgi:polar amino acid transport system substrate-binding protein
MTTRLLSLCLCTFACGLLFALSAPACELRMRWSDDPPYLMRGAQGEITGLQAELVGATVQRMGCRLRWLELPWARALLELQAGWTS